MGLKTGWGIDLAMTNTTSGWRIMDSGKIFIAEKIEDDDFILNLWDLP